MHILSIKVREYTDNTEAAMHFINGVQWHRDMLLAKAMDSDRMLYDKKDIINLIKSIADGE